MMPGHRYRCRIVPVAEGGYVLTLTAPNGHGGAQHFATVAEAFEGVAGLYAAITFQSTPRGATSEPTMAAFSLTDKHPERHRA